MDTIIASIITGILGLITGGLPFIVNHFKNRDTRPRSYVDRNSATDSMFTDMEFSRKMVFLGISNTSLGGYFIDFLDKISKEGKILKWEEIDIYFSNDDCGRAWDSNFDHKIVGSIQAISTALTNPLIKKLVPALKKINFYQNTLPSYYGGSLFCTKDNVPIDEFNICYVVHYTNSADREVKSSYSERLTIKAKLHFSHYMNSFSFLKNTAKILFQLDTNNLWEISADAWGNFENRFGIYSTIMDKFIDFCKIRNTERIIDLGCGTGLLTSKIIRKNQQVNILLLDNSAQMLSKANKLFSGNDNVRSILSNAQSSEPLYGNLKTKRYNKILTAFSLQCFLNHNDSINSFVTRWKSHLNDCGEIILLIHNSCLTATDFTQYIPSEFVGWNDPLREGMQKVAQNMNLNIRADLRRTFGLLEIDSGFTTAGFTKVDSAFCLFDRTIDDRKEMWRVPAILNSFLDLRDMEKNSITINQFMCHIDNLNLNSNSMPTIAYFVKYRINDKCVTKCK